MGHSDWKNFVTLAGGCVPEASTLPPVTVSQIFLNIKGHLLFVFHEPILQVKITSVCAKIDQD